MNDKYEEYLMVVSTESVSPESESEFLKTNTGELLGHCTGSKFGTQFYPIIAITRKGQIKNVSKSNNLPEDTVLFVIPDNCTIDPGFTDNDKKLPALNVKCIYALLHRGGDDPEINRKAREHTKVLEEKFPEKLHVEYSRHLIREGDDEYILGNGLEAIAETFKDSKVDAEVLKDEIEYMVEKAFFERLRKDFVRNIIKSMKDYEECDKQTLKVRNEIKNEILRYLRTAEFKDILEKFDKDGVVNYNDPEGIFSDPEKWKQLVELLYSVFGGLFKKNRDKGA